MFLLLKIVYQETSNKSSLALQVCEAVSWEGRGQTFWAPHLVTFTLSLFALLNLYLTQVPVENISLKCMRFFSRMTCVNAISYVGLLFLWTDKSRKLPWAMLPLNGVFSSQSTQIFIFLLLIKYWVWQYWIFSGVLRGKGKPPVPPHTHTHIILMKDSIGIPLKHLQSHGTTNGLESSSCLPDAFPHSLNNFNQWCSLSCQG